MPITLTQVQRTFFENHPHALFTDIGCSRIMLFAHCSLLNVWHRTQIAQDLRHQFVVETNVLVILGILGTGTEFEAFSL